ESYLQRRPGGTEPDHAYYGDGPDGERQAQTRSEARPSEAVPGTLDIWVVLLARKPTHALGEVGVNSGSIEERAERRGEQQRHEQQPELKPVHIGPAERQLHGDEGHRRPQHRP